MNAALGGLAVFSPVPGHGMTRYEAELESRFC